MIPLIDILFSFYKPWKLSISILKSGLSVLCVSLFGSTAFLPTGESCCYWTFESPYKFETSSGTAGWAFLVLLIFSRMINPNYIYLNYIRVTLKVYSNQWSSILETKKLKSSNYFDTITKKSGAMETHTYRFRPLQRFWTVPTLMFRDCAHLLLRMKK